MTYQKNSISINIELPPSTPSPLFYGEEKGKTKWIVNQVNNQLPNSTTYFAWDLSAGCFASELWENYSSNSLDGAWIYSNIKK